MPALSDDEVFDAIVDLVVRGEYLDEIPGVPQPAAAAGLRIDDPSGRQHARRLYERGSEEYLTAKAAGLVELLPSPPQPPASQELVDDAEHELGYPLPPLLRRLYLEVANGGFGPGYGILGLRGGHGVAPTGTAIDRYRRFRAGEQPPPASLFPVCDWGCAITSFVDCSDSGAAMWGFDPNLVYDNARALFRQEMGLAEWLQLWVEGRLYQPWVVQDPTTGEWRGATNDETARSLLGSWEPDDLR